MAAIVTLTMNPALDLATETEEIRPTVKLRCSTPRFDPGGGGINVARVVKRLGGDTLALFPAGGAAGSMLKELISAEGVPYRTIPIAGHSRQSLVVTEHQTGLQYRFVLPGPEISAAEQQACLDAVAELSPAPGYLVMSGSLPPGVRPDFVVRVAEIARRIGARLVLDMAGDGPRAAAGAGVFLLKPNEEEFAELVGRPIGDEEDMIAAGRQLIEHGLADVIVVSLGERGALLVSADTAEWISAPEVPVVSAVGAGDSMVAGMVCGLASGLSLREAVRLGVAAGAAALITPGSELARREDVEGLSRALADPG